jgi:hypothetical protein
MRGLVAGHVKIAEEGALVLAATSSVRGTTLVTSSGLLDSSLLDSCQLDPQALYNLVAGAAWVIQVGRAARYDFTQMITELLLHGVIRS